MRPNVLEQIQLPDDAVRNISGNYRLDLPELSATSPVQRSLLKIVFSLLFPPHNIEIYIPVAVLLFTCLNLRTSMVIAPRWHMASEFGVSCFWDSIISWFCFSC